MTCYREMLKQELELKISDMPRKGTVFTDKRPKNTLKTVKTVLGEEHIKKTKPRNDVGKSWLDDHGRLMISGQPQADLSRLELLICLGASVKEIELHIHHLGTPKQWEQWVGGQYFCERIMDRRSSK